MAFPSSFSSSSWYSAYPSLDDFDPPLYTTNPSVDLFLPPSYPSFVDNILPQENNVGINTHYITQSEDGASRFILPQENKADINTHYIASHEDGTGHISILPQENYAGLNTHYIASSEDGASHISILPQENNAYINTYYIASSKDESGHINILPQENNADINTHYILPQENNVSLNTQYYFASSEDDAYRISADNVLPQEDKVVRDWRLNLPAGVKFRPTDKELITHYLKRQFLDGPSPYSFEPVTYADIYDYEPQQLLGMGEDHGDGKRCFYTQIKKMGKLHDQRKKTTHDKTHRSIKSKKGTWRPTQKAREIMGDNGVIIGFKTPLAYYEGNQKTQWLMQEFKLPSSHHSSHQLVLAVVYYHGRRKRGQDIDDEN